MAWGWFSPPIKTVTAAGVIVVEQPVSSAATSLYLTIAWRSRFLPTARAGQQQRCNNGSWICCSRQQKIQMAKSRSNALRAYSPVCKRDSWIDLC